MKRIHRALILVASAFGVICLALLYFTPASYLYCLARESAWIECKSKNELERSLLCFYTSRQISSKDSMWGRDYEFRKGERMVQYLIFSKEPLDVVYDEENKVIRMFTSYE